MLVYQEEVARHLAEFLSHMRHGDRTLAGRSLARAWLVISAKTFGSPDFKSVEVVLFAACERAYDALYSAA